MKWVLGRKILTSIALVAIIVQSFSPYLAVLPKAYAQDATPTPAIEQPSPTPDQTAPTVTPAQDVTLNVTPTPTDTSIPNSNHSSNTN